MSQRQDTPLRRPHSIIRRDDEPDGTCTGQTSAQLNGPPIVVYGAFSSAWSYLASSRAALLEADGLYVDWRVVGDKIGFGDQPNELERFEATRREMERVVSALLPGERLPYSLAGFLTNTGAAAEAYARAYDVGVASTIRRLIFQAFWVHAIDLDDEESIRTLMMDASPALSDAGAGSQIRDGRSTPLISQWAWDWDSLGRPPLPAMTCEGRVRRCGDEAVAWLGTQLLHRDVDIESARSDAQKAPLPSGPGATRHHAPRRPLHRPAKRRGMGERRVDEPTASGPPMRCPAV